MGAERLLLRREPLLRGVHPVHPGLSHGPHPLLRRERLDLPHRRLQLTAVRQLRCLVGVQRHGREHAGHRLGRRHREPRGLHVAPGLHHAGHGGVPRGGHGVRHGHAHQPVLHVQVGVVVHHGVRQGLRQRRESEVALLPVDVGVRTPLGALPVRGAGRQRVPLGVVGGGRLTGNGGGALAVRPQGLGQGCLDHGSTIGDDAARPARADPHRPVRAPPTDPDRGAGAMRADLRNS